MAPRTETRAPCPPVLLVGFSQEDRERLEGLIEDLPRLFVQEEVDARRLLREREVSAVALGGGVRGERARRFVAEALDAGPECAPPFLVVAGGPDLSRFQDLVDRDALFYLGREPPAAGALAALVRSAASRDPGLAREPVTDAAGLQQALAAARRVAIQRDLHEAGDLLTEEVVDLVAADRAYSLVHDPEEEALRAGRPGSPEERVESPAVGLVSFVLRTGRAVMLETVNEDPRYDREADDPAGAGGERFLAVPLAGSDGVTVGVLAAVREPHRSCFSERELRLLQRLAGFVAGTLEQLALQERLDRDAAERERQAGNPIFRREALAAREAGLRDSGDLLRLSPRRPARDHAAPSRSLGRSRGRRIPFVRQTAVSDCGSACLAMVLGLHGRRVGLAEVRDVLGHGRGGADALRLLETARWFGLRGRAVRIDRLDELARVPRGAILHWRFRHFVVFDRAVDGGLEVVDPAGGHRRVTTAEADRAFTGIALVFEPADDFRPGGAKRGGRLGWHYLRQVLAEKRLLHRIVGASVLVQLFALSVPLLVGILVDRVLPRGDRNLLAILGIGLAAIVGFHFLASLARSRLLLHLRTKVDSRLTLGFLDHMVRLPYEFFQTRSAGDLLMRLGSNATVREILTSGVLSAVLDGVLVSLYLGLLFTVAPSMAALVVALGALRVLVFLAARRKHRDTISQGLHQQARSQGYQVQMLAGMETLKASGAEHRAVEHWSHLFVDSLNASVARGRVEAWVDSALTALAIGSPLAVLLYGGHLVLAGELSLGVMLAVNAVAMGFLQPLSKLVETAFDLQRMGSYLDRIEDVLATPREQEGRDTVPAPRLRGGITLEGVTFRYAPALPPAVREVSVEIERGSFVALVGRSGAGKSTLAALMVGLYQPQEGRIAFDGRSLADLDLGSVRRQLGIVPQHPYLFGGTLRGNVALSDPGLQLGQVIEAARRAHVHDEIAAMPMGYETALADGGTSLSGGQRQRIALARALATRPAILLLDEATSHLDAITEARIHRELEGLRATRIVISHRLSTVRRADQILVLEGGRIVERGTHAELLARGGLYRDLVEEQLEKDDGEEPVQSSRIAAVGDE